MTTSTSRRPAKTQDWTETGQVQRARARRPLRTAWIELLSRYHWQWFCTLTFPDTVSEHRAERAFNLWISRINRALFRSRWFKKPAKVLFWIRVSEPQARGVLHYRTLIGCLSKDLRHHVTRSFADRTWGRLAGFCRIEDVRSQHRVIRYVTKSVTTNAEVAFSSNLKAVTSLEWTEGSPPNLGGFDKD